MEYHKNAPLTAGSRERLETSPVDAIPNTRPVPNRIESLLRSAPPAEMFPIKANGQPPEKVLE